MADWSESSLLCKARQPASAVGTFPLHQKSASWCGHEARLFVLDRSVCCHGPKYFCGPLGFCCICYGV